MLLVLNFFSLFPLTRYEWRSVCLVLAIGLISHLSCEARDYSPSECSVVGNTNSRIYHTEGGEFYARMLRRNKKGGDNRQCFNTVQQARQTGYRASRR